LMASASEQQQQTLWAVAGPNLVKIDGRATPARCELIALPTDLGPLRSVQSCDDGSGRLLVGAQSGVMALDPKNAAAATRYADRAITSPLGFNSVVATSGMIWATHGEAGVVAWNADAADARDKPAFVLRPQSPGKAPRNAVALDDGRILYSAGDLYVADATGVADVVAATTASVAFIAVQSDEVLVAYDNGTVARFGRQNLEPRGSARCCGEITAGATLPWLGTTR